MNDLGMTLAWSAIQITLILVPAAFLHALASRRSPASGSWIATLGLALSLAIGAATLIPWHRQAAAVSATSMAVDVPARAAEARQGENPDVAVPGEASPFSDAARFADHLSFGFERFLGLWSRLQSAPIVPVARFRRWGSVLAVAGIAGAAAGLFRLFVGLWAVRLCRRRGTIVNDPPLMALSDKIQRELGCHQHVEIREVPDLTTPATAGWRHPVILLPDDWRSWDDTDRRAVLAHELAHIHRWDYAAGLVARLALALEFYHPLVHWLARRLQLQQELAADAVGARFAGGRDLYLLSLSRLALRQNGRSPCWPARAFLPARGTLIRRIAMLQDESTKTDRPWSRSRRLLAGLCLLGAAGGVALLRGPARGDENEKHPDTVKAPAPASPKAAKAGTTPFDRRYVSDETEAMIAFRPAAAFRRTGTPSFSSLGNMVGFDLSDLPKQLKIDPSAPGRLQLGLDDIEWVILGLHYGSTKDSSGQKRHTVQSGRLIVRATNPFDWLRFLREWRLEFSQAHEGGRGYFKIVGHLQTLIGGNPCVYLPDDRTIVLDQEATIQKMLRSDKPTVPAYLAGADWERFSRGILAMAINNRDQEFAKNYDLGLPDDALALSLFKGVDHWILGVDNADAIAVHATAVCSTGAGAKIARAVEPLLKMARDTLENPQKVEAPTEPSERSLRMSRTLLRNLRVSHDDHSVNLHAEDFGTLAELGSIVGALFKEPVETVAGRRP